ncbi:MAG: DNA repair protein RecN [Pelagibacterales bacterium]|nr:DNA repair protein RecN [Pelagibacterales bacterium]OUU62057.1 MAG: DNA repair protein RecN [Alphaproteobacteria bacterium TMED62]|tara:strand:- start:6814 stop:8484 length:1671 start_codon:yes stop_codon:yes gene_type:complete
MLKSLTIKNIVLIDNLRLSYNSGFSVFSGETGAGKSIILSSLGLAIGMRADFSLIRKGVNEGVVTAEFQINKDHLAYKKIINHGLTSEENLILRRVLTKDGISKAFVNDNLVTANFLKELGLILVEIHGQNEKIGLLDSSNHIKILDRYSKSDDKLLEVVNSYNNYKKLNKILHELDSIESNKVNQLEEIKNDLNLLENLNLGKEEYQELIKKRNIMTQHEKIFTALNNINNLLEGEEVSFLSNVSKNSLSLEKVFSKDNKIEEVEALQKSINAILIEGKDILLNISKIRDSFNFDQRELDHIEQRLFDINNLARRFKVEPENLNTIRNKLKDELEILINSSESYEKVKNKLFQAKQTYYKNAKILSNHRKKFASHLENLINKELVPLKLEDAKFEVEVIENVANKENQNGIDNIKFLVRMNKGGVKGEIHKVSSGGELSRLMLAINLVIANSLSKKTLVFDEVDSGISGSVAEAIAIRLLNLSNTQQILVVTHLPQVAAKGKQHFKTFKFFKNNITVTGVTELSYEGRIEEVATMISGDKITEEARLLSKKLLHN